MNPTLPARRALLTLGLGLVTAAALPVALRAAPPAIHVVKDPDCGCCGAWIDILQRDGFTVTTEHLAPEALQALKRDSGIPEALASCHTARIEGYVVEGHVPVADIRRLLAERPDAIGLAVPGMPYGAPGMGPDSDRDAYDVHLILRGGGSRVFTRYAAG